MIYDVEVGHQALAKKEAMGVVLVYGQTLIILINNIDKANIKNAGSQRNCLFIMLAIYIGHACESTAIYSKCYQSILSAGGGCRVQRHSECSSPVDSFPFCEGETMPKF